MQFARKSAMEILPGESHIRTPCMCRLRFAPCQPFIQTLSGIRQSHQIEGYDENVLVCRGVQTSIVSLFLPSYQHGVSWYSEIELDSGYQHAGMT